MLGISELHVSAMFWNITLSFELVRTSCPNSQIFNRLVLSAIITMLHFLIG